MDPFSRWLGDAATYRMVTLALVIGGVAGLAGVGLRVSAFYLQSLLVFDQAPARTFLPIYFLPFLPAIGGLVVGLIAMGLLQEVRGAGVADVILAVRYRGSRLRARVAALKMAATSIAIGTGGSAGIEGPIIQIGSALGSGLGQRLRLPEEELRVTLAAGAAGGIAATFNTPLAGVFFALEIILVDFSSRSFGLVVLASVVASIVSRAVLGSDPIFPVPNYSLVHPTELLLYFGLGIASAAVGLAFIFTLDWVEALASRWSIPGYLKPAAGGLAVGLIGLAFPQVLGLGYGAIGDALNNRLPLGLMAALVLAKVLATSLTVGSGSSGGVIGPSLYLGAMLGGVVGTVVNILLPESTAGPGAYALAGMATVFSATAQAPITAIFTIFEMTGDSYHIVPLMVACSTSAYLAHRVSPHTIYSVGLRRRGIDLQTGRVSLPPMHGTMYLRLIVGERSAAAGKRVEELGLPPDCILISVQRQDHTLIPRGGTSLEAGDVIVAAVVPEAAAALRALVARRE